MSPLTQGIVSSMYNYTLELCVAVIYENDRQYSIKIIFWVANLSTLRTYYCFVPAKTIVIDEALWKDS